ncbi:hypothetical protein O6H91_06G014500 [Diphasiastrum complanatum]|uniref:Uncharacterized protein n=3 Tax=Diphasiastrum complanatum TaxID=34168 RepID=A0ACC2DB37_DIPCM|nr:hypothetical protein O6H91_06G014500 [Diphasiastrum complanatum]KAJ7551417.1 hypothetical protein O6H91_06G014500 [Diphasiastrum complanatum]KAJ7551418.1 hypothetical protein O6H91_06G014500 [Diphasiastrum complanatum]
MSLEAASNHGVRITAQAAYRLLQRCMNSKDLKTGRAVQSLIASSELGTNILLGNQLIRLFSLCGSLPDAIQAFRKICNPDTHSWTAILNAYLKHGDGSNAIKLYHEMRKSRTKPNDYVYVAVLKACTSLSALAQGKEIHAHIVESGYESNIYVGNALIDMYARSGSLKDSCQVFDRLVGRDVVSWNALITGYVQHGLGVQALDLFQKMLHEGVKPDKITFLNVLKACSCSATLDEAKFIHSQICEKGLDSDGSLKNALVNMYAKCGSLDEARKVFDQILERDIVTWSAMISGYAQHGFGQEALRVFYDMQDQGIRPDAMTYMSILKACGTIAALDQGMQIHQQVVADGLESDVFIGSSLVDMYAKCGSLDQARCLFERLPTKNVVSWNLMIKSYAKNGLAKHVLQLYEEMKLAQVRPDSFTFVAVLKVCGSIGAIERGKSLHKEVIQIGVEVDMLIGNALIDMYMKCGCLQDAANVFDSLPKRDLVSWNAMIVGYSRQSLILEVLCYFSTMQLEGMKPDTASYVGILQACGSTADINTGKMIHAQICEIGLESDVFIGNSLVGMYAKCGKMDESLQILDNLPVKTVAAYNAIISGYVKHGHCKLALQTFNDMKEKGMRPDHVTFTSILKGCGIFAALDEGSLIHKQIIESGFVENMHVCNTLIDMYAKCGSLEKTFQVFNNLPQRDVVSWNAMIGGYAQGGFGQQALQLYRLLDEEGIKPDSVTFVNVLKSCGSLASIDEGRLIHSRAIKAGFDSDVYVGSAIVDMYAKCGSLEEARKAFDNIVKKDTVSWSTLISAYVYNGLSHQSLQFFNKMQMEGVRPDGATFVSVLKACGSIADMHQGKLIHAQILKRGLQSDTRVGSALVDMYGRCGSANMARKIFDALPEKDILSWNTIITTYAQHGFGHEALILFKNMQKYGMKPNNATFVSLLSACSHSSLVEEGLGLYHSMIEDYGLSPQKQHIASMVDLLSRSGNTRLTEDLHMPSEPI